MNKERQNNGNFLNCPGPGRPPGCKNKFTQIKQDIVDVWKECGGKQRMRELLLNSNNKKVLKNIDNILSVIHSIK